MAELFGVGTSFVNKLLDLHRRGQAIAPRPHGGGYPARLLPRHGKLLRSRVRQRQDATLEELRAHLEEQAGLAVSVSTVSRALIRLDLGRKKSLAASAITTSAGGSAAAPASSITGDSSSSMRPQSTRR